MAQRPRPAPPAPIRSEAQRAFGQHVKGLRKARGLSQEELAHRIGMSVDAISSLERGVTFASFDTLLKMARELECRLIDLFDFEPRPETAPEIVQLVGLLSTQPTAVRRTVLRQVEALVELVGGERT